MQNSGQILKIGINIVGNRWFLIKNKMPIKIDSATIELIEEKNDLDLMVQVVF